MLLACKEAIQVDLDTGLLRELPVKELVELGPENPLRTDIGVARLNDRTLTPASELLLNYALETAASCLA